MHYNDISATSDLDKAQLFNDNFHSVFSTSTGTPLSVLETHDILYSSPIQMFLSCLHP